MRLPGSSNTQTHAHVYTHAHTMHTHSLHKEFVLWVENCKAKEVTTVFYKHKSSHEAILWKRSLSRLLPGFLSQSVPNSALRGNLWNRVHDLSAQNLLLAPDLRLKIGVRSKACRTGLDFHPSHSPLWPHLPGLWLSYALLLPLAGPSTHLAHSCPEHFLFFL